MKRSYSVSLLLSLVTGTLILVLVAVFALSALDAWQRERFTSNIMIGVRISRDIVQARETLRVELGWIDTTIAAPKVANPETLDRLMRLHRRSMAALTLVEQEISQAQGVDVPPLLAQRLTGDMARFDKQLFPEIIGAAQRPKDSRPRNLVEDPKSATNAILSLIDSQAAVLSRDIAGFGPYLGEMMRVSDIAWHVRVDAGDDRRVMATLIAQRRPPSEAEREQMIKVSGRIEAPWQSIRDVTLDAPMPSALSAAMAAANKRYFGDYRSFCQQVLGRLSRGEPVNIGDEEWLFISNPALASLMQVSKAALEAAATRAQGNLVKARRDLLVALALMALSIGLAFVSAAIVQLGVIVPLKAITRAMTGGQEGDIDRALEFSARGDEIGHFARALKASRQGAIERQRLENELLRNQAAKEAAEAASRVKSEFLANMSHELRTPLNAVIGFSEVMLHKTFGPMSERYEEYTGLIHDAGNHLLSLVSDILDLAKIEAGRFAADFRCIDLSTCSVQCLALVKRRAEERQIRIVAELPQEKVELEADARACKQILLNLLSNAVKFSRPYGTLHLRLRTLDEEVQISVEDEGIGISADLLSRIGQPFEQVSNNPMLAREGTGLGLALVKALVQEHHGTMWVESQEDVGTRITITLPRHQRAAPAKAA